MPPSPRPPKSESASAVLARVAPQVSRWVERSLAEHDPSLTPAQYLALEQLDRGDVGAADLAQGAAVSRAAVSQLVASLDALGLVDRVEAVKDRRQHALRLSEEGKHTLRSARRLLQKRLDPLLDQLPRPETDKLVRSLSRLEEALGGSPPPRRPPPRKPPPPPRRR
jgi:DNA-binding MarR family transcriptional regulator